MSNRSRRDFLKTTSLGAVGLSALDLVQEPTLAGAGEAVAAEVLPPHRALDVPGVHAYPTRHSIAGGETLELHTSTSRPYRLSICRLGSSLDDSSGDAVLETFPEARPLEHPIHPGSYVHCDKKLDGPLNALTLECWVRPWSIAADAGLVTQYDFKAACGFGLFLAPGGAVAFYVGDGGDHRVEWLLSSAAGVLKVGRWSHVAGVWDGKEKTLWVDGRRVGQGAFEGLAAGGSSPLRLAAHGDGGVAARFLDGDLALPAIHGRALRETEIAQRHRDQGLTPPHGQDVIACWPLDEERGARVGDSSGRGYDGRIVNHATWMIGGPSFHADVPRFGGYDPKLDARRGHGLRFASDDLYDCRWPVTHRWVVPVDAKPGLYVARFHFDWEGEPRVAHMTFVVRRAAGRPKPPILVLASTNTWRAYSGTPFALTPRQSRFLAGTGGVGKLVPGVPAFNLYRTHQADQGSYQVGLRMPWPAAGPYVLYGEQPGYSHLARADRFAHVWLEQNGYDYDLISDLDLHHRPEVLNEYRVVVINGHSEYWSAPMFHGLENYLGGGGHVVVLSGNTLFWRVSFDPGETVMECRKVDAAGFQVPPGRRGEAWHSHDGLRGGMMRECGYPGWRLVGLDTLGFIDPGKAENFGPYVAELTDHPFFQTPEKTDLKPGDRFGWAGPGKAPMANGHEIDVRPSTLASLQQEPSPAGAVVPADPPGIVRLANGSLSWARSGVAFDFFFRRIQPKADQGGELIDWRRPDGGRVFNAGSIGAGWALHADPRWSAMLRNVLHHFGVPGSQKSG